MGQFSNKWIINWNWGQNWRKPIRDRSICQLSLFWGSFSVAAPFNQKVHNCFQIISFCKADAILPWRVSHSAFASIGKKWFWCWMVAIDGCSKFLDGRTVGSIVNTDQVSKQEQENVDLKWRSQVGFGWSGVQIFLEFLNCCCCKRNNWNNFTTFSNFPNEGTDSKL